MGYRFALVPLNETPRFHLFAGEPERHPPEIDERPALLYEVNYLLKGIDGECLVEGIDYGIDIAGGEAFA